MVLLREAVGLPRSNERQSRQLNVAAPDVFTQALKAGLSPCPASRTDQNQLNTPLEHAAKGIRVEVAQTCRGPPRRAEVETPQRQKPQS